MTRSRLTHMTPAAPLRSVTSVYTGACWLVQPNPASTHVSKNWLELPAIFSFLVSFLDENVTTIWPFIIIIITDCEFTTISYNSHEPPSIGIGLCEQWRRWSGVSACFAWAPIVPVFFSCLSLSCPSFSSPLFPPFFFHCPPWNDTPNPAMGSRGAGTWAEPIRISILVCVEQGCREGL